MIAKFIRYIVKKVDLRVKLDGNVVTVTISYHGIQILQREIPINIKGGK